MRVCKEDGCTESLEGRHSASTKCISRQCQSNREAIRNAENREKMRIKRDRVRKKEAAEIRKAIESNKI